MNRTAARRANTATNKKARPSAVSSAVLPTKSSAGASGSSRGTVNSIINGIAGITGANGTNGVHGANGSHGTNAQPAGESLEQCVFRSLDQYFADLDGAKPHALHEMVLSAIERPLLQFALRRCDGNQSAAAELLGINRNTLRRKLQDYGLH